MITSSLARLLRRSLPALATIALSPSLFAQGRLAWNAPPTVGSWAAFDLTVDQNGKQSSGTYRLSCLEKARLDGIDYVWCEIVREKGSKKKVIKVLLPQDAVASSDAPLSQAREVIYQDQGKKAMRATGSTLSSVVSLLGSIQGDTPLTYEAAGRDDIQLPDGTKVSAFKKTGRSDLTLPNQEPTHVESTVWVVKDVPFGLGKSVVTTVQGKGAAEHRKTETLVLKSQGTTGAMSQITGPVVPFNPIDLLLGGK